MTDAELTAFLGTVTAEDVRAVRGVPNDPVECSLARLLRRRLRGSVWAGHDFVLVYWKDQAAAPWSLLPPHLVEGAPC